MRKKLLLLFILSCGILMGSRGIALSMSRDETATIFERIRSTYRRFEKEVRDMTITQTVESTLPEGTILTESTMYKKGAQFRIDIDMKEVTIGGMPQNTSTGKMTVIYDGKDIWMHSPVMGKKKLPRREELEYTMLWKRRASNLAMSAIAGEEKIGMFDCYIIEMRASKDFPVTKMWVEKKDLLVIRQEAIQPGNETVRIDFSDFKGRWKIPHTTRVYSDNGLTSTTHVKTVRTNSGFSSDIFLVNRKDHQDVDINMDEINMILEAMEKSKAEKMTK